MGLAIKVTDLFKSFKVGIQDIEVLKGVSFEINEKDFAVIIGPSGSGKSTILHTILGLEPPTSGQVLCLEEDLYSNKNDDDRSDFRKKHIGMVYQQPNWIKSLSVIDNIAFPLFLLGHPRAEALKRSWVSLRNMGMEPWANYVPTELSGGQQQKIALCRALVIDPQIIIADEPTGNLDFESGKELMNLLRKFNELGKTVIMVTHDLEYLRYARTVIRILDGKIIESLSGEESGEYIKNMTTKGKANVNLKDANDQQDQTNI